jgi:hypothetical protein
MNGIPHMCRPNARSLLCQTEGEYGGSIRSAFRKRGLAERTVVLLLPSIYGLLFSENLNDEVGLSLVRLDVEALTKSESQCERNYELTLGAPSQSAAEICI